MAAPVKILLVDDQPPRLLSYQAILSQLGHELVTATSGREALQLLMGDDFAVILLDVNMPIMDGFETAELIRQHPRFEKTPIIFVTAFHMTDIDRLKGYGLGAVDYVFIPVVPEILRSKVSVFVELYSKRRELQELNHELQRANAELFEANSALMTEKTREVQALNRTLERANQELQRANETLRAEANERRLAETALRKSEEALKLADRRKDEFIAMLAHELRNPLVPIINAVQIMADNAVPGSRIDWCRELIGRQAEHLSRLVEDLLDVSRISKGMIKLHVEHVDLVQVVARAIETAKPVIDARRHALVPHLPAAPVWVLGDHTRLLQVVGNLLNNAAKFTDPGGRVGVTLGVEDRRALLRVQDNGRGIAPEMLSQVFDLFAQVDPSLDRTEGGLGVGLALVRRLVAQHGGEVAVNSEGLGKGATFEVRLPLLAPDQVPEANVKPPRRTQSLPARKILVVDDNADAALSLAMLLRMGGNVVDVAHDGQVGCEIAERFRPEIALLDIGMPRMNGYDACRRLRSEPWGKDMVLIALTGWGQEEVRTRIYDAGFDLHLIKPVDPALLGDLLAFLSSEPRPSRSSLRRWAPGSGRISAPASS